MQLDRIEREICCNLLDELELLVHKNANDFRLPESGPNGCDNFSSNRRRDAAQTLR